MATRSLFRSSARVLNTKNAFSTQSPATVLYSWGDGTHGQLGHAKFEKVDTPFGESQYLQEVPRRLVKSKRFQSIAVGGNYTLGLTKTGEVFGWGAKALFNTAQDVMEPTLITTAAKIKSIAAGPKHAALVDAGGLVYTWGEGGSWFRGGGMLGHGDKSERKEPELVRALQDYEARAQSVACGGHHTVILTDDGEVLSCGLGEYGRLGTGTNSDSHIPMPLDSLAEEDVVAVAAGFDHSLALTAQGTLFSWGRNQSGQLGHLDSFLDIYSMEDFPRAIESPAEGSPPGCRMDNFAQVAAGNARSAAVTKDGLLYVWGVRISNAPKLIEKHLVDGLRVTKVACGGADAGSAVVAFLTEDGGLWTMGEASSHLLGHAAKGKQLTPLRVPALVGKRVVDISCGESKHMFAFVAADDE